VGKTGNAAILKEATVRNHWMVLFVKAITKSYDKGISRELTRQCAGDMHDRGFEHAKEYWGKLMRFHYGALINDDDYLIKSAMMKRDRGLGILGIRQRKYYRG